MKDLVILAIGNYSWEQIKPLYNSLKKSGYKGDIAAIIYQDPHNIQRDLKEHDIITYLPMTNHLGKNAMKSVQNDRFYHMWEFLNTLPEYNRIMSIDSRDVIFQSNPSEYLDEHLGDFDILVPSEGLAYKDEIWGRQNFHESFGNKLYEWVKNSTRSSVGGW